LRGAIIDLGSCILEGAQHLCAIALNRRLKDLF
jgi:hypothetical protein